MQWASLSYYWSKPEYHAETEPVVFGSAGQTGSNPFTCDRDEIIIRQPNSVGTQSRTLT
jgi:hypothetical protein